MAERCVGIDYGRKRTGIAISDPLGIFSIPVGTYTPTRAIEKMQDIDATEGIRRLVIGWPVTLDGEEKEASERVRHFINRLKKVFPGVEIVKIDERYSSTRAMQALIGANVKRKARRQKERIDSAAAAIILQDFLDEHAC